MAIARSNGALQQVDARRKRNVSVTARRFLVSTLAGNLSQRKKPLYRDQNIPRFSDDQGSAVSYQDDVFGVGYAGCGIFGISVNALIA